jgi:hypothetical protein
MTREYGSNQKYHIRIRKIGQDLVKIRAYICEHLIQDEKEDWLSEYHILYQDKEYEMISILPRFACRLSFTARVTPALENFRDLENRA